MSGAGSVSRAGLVCRDDLEPGIVRRRASPGEI